MGWQGYDWGCQTDKKFRTSASPCPTPARRECRQEPPGSLTPNTAPQTAGNASKMNFATLNAALAARRSSDHAINYIESEGNERVLPFSQLYSRAAGLLYHIQSCGARPGTEMILLLDRDEQFVDAFWACILGNIVAVPIAPGATDEHRLKLFRVLQKLEQPHLCTDRRIFARLTKYAADNALMAEIERIKPATFFLDQLDDISRPGRVQAAKPDDIAFVQYSSGSTSEPKGVALTHRNIIANILAIARGIGLTDADAG